MPRGPGAPDRDRSPPVAPGAEPERATASSPALSRAEWAARLRRALRPTADPRLALPGATLDPRGDRSRPAASIEAPTPPVPEITAPADGVGDLVYEDGAGRRWGVGAGKLYLGRIEIPIPLGAISIPLGGPPDLPPPAPVPPPPPGYAGPPESAADSILGVEDWAGGAAGDEVGFLTGPRGVRLHYRLVGEGTDTLVVVQGRPGTGGDDILPSILPLAGSRTLLLHDRRGGGGSDLRQRAAAFDADALVEGLEAVRRHFGLERMDVVAHSFGAVLLAEYAVRHPERLRRVVLHAASGPGRDQARPRRFGDRDYAESLVEVTAEVLVLRGELDEAGATEQRAWAAAYPRGRLLTVAGSGNDAFRDAPGVVFPALEAFFTGAWPAGAKVVDADRPAP